MTATTRVHPLRQQEDALLEQLQQAPNALILQLSRFPEKPRGKHLPGRDKALANAQKLIARLRQRGASSEEAMTWAASELQELADEWEYRQPNPEPQHRLRLQVGAAFVSDIADAERDEAIITRIAQTAGLGTRGSGNRTQHGPLGEMVRALRAMQSMGMRLPAPAIRPYHLQCHEFVEVLRRQRFLLRADMAGVEDVDRVASGLPDFGKLRRLSRAAAHRVKLAVALLSDSE